MSKEIFLIDANSLITPHLTFYPFDFAPGFWKNSKPRGLMDPYFIFIISYRNRYFVSPAFGSAESK